MKFELQPQRRPTWTITPAGLSLVNGSSAPAVVTFLQQASPPLTQTLYMGSVGPAGPAGQEVATYTAASVINGHKLLMSAGAGLVQHADISDPSAPLLFVGMTETAATTGAALQVRRYGAITYLGWDWDDDLVYLGTNGDPTQTVPDGAAAVFPVGFGSGSVLYLNPQPPLYLS